MRRDIEPIELPAQLQANYEEPSKSPPERSWRDRWIQSLFSWRIPVWIGVPVTVVATIGLFFILSYFNDREAVTIVTGYETAEKQTYQVVSYQDKAAVVFTAPKGNIPGIGFFGAARKRSEPFEGLQVKMQDDRHFLLKWSKIRTARLYEVQIYSVNNNGRILVGQAATSGNTEVLLQVLGIMPGKRYEWELIGQTTDNGSFLARGGFIVGVEVRF